MRMSDCSADVCSSDLLFDRLLAINGALFKTDIKGAQQFEFFPSVGLQTTVGIDKVKIQGFDLDFDAQLPFGLRLFGGYGYTDGEVSQFNGIDRKSVV